MMLSVRDLRTHFVTDAGVLPSVDGVSFEVATGESVGIVGESGCGKSVTALSILRLVEMPPGRIVGGAVLFKGRDLLQLPMRDLRHVRGNEIAMIFQEPMTSLNPVYTVGQQIIEAITLHRAVSMAAARKRAIETLHRVGIPSPGVRVDEYPHQLSGGMQQRVMIAMALSCEPKLLIADEPTTALDVTIQAQVLELLRRLQQERGMAILLITHDLAVVAETCARVVVMYAGKVVETGTTDDVLRSPMHPYTYGLLASLPEHTQPGQRLATIPGNVPSPLDFPSGCRFRSRCARATAECAMAPPRVDRGDHSAWCVWPLAHG
jgi:peptide/nickel transport system ATP-binding protein/oligopeptide transport system ATP-binding protein